MTGEKAITCEEAIREIKNMAKFNYTLAPKEVFDMVIKALERNTPMKVNVEKWIYTECPSGCGYELSTHHGDGYYSIDNKPEFCPNCGQALLWESEEKE